MTDAKVAEPNPRPPLRLWPGAVGAALILLAALVGAVATEVLPFAMMGAVGDVLLVRNGQEMAAFRLARAGG